MVDVHNRRSRRQPAQVQIFEQVETPKRLRPDFSYPLLPTMHVVPH